jgi:hypothetical protein
VLLIVMSDCGGAAAGASLVVAVGGGDVRPAAELQDADGEVAQSGHDCGSVADADLGGLLAVGDITDVVQRLDLPVAADPGGDGGVVSCVPQPFAVARAFRRSSASSFFSLALSPSRSRSSMAA